MSCEPGIIDANVLVYAMDEDASQHAASRSLLEAGRDPSTTLYVTSQILCGFDSIVTNARRVRKPRLLPTRWERFPVCLLFFMCCQFRHTSGRVAQLASPSPRNR
jgi:predicted nucleic acid-binding protein